MLTALFGLRFYVRYGGKFLVQCIFPAADQDVVGWARAIGLDVSVAGDILILQTHVTALLLEVPDANRALRRRTISRLHPMFFSEPESALEDMFFSQSGNHSQTLCPLQLEVSGCLFVLGNTFLTTWRNAWRDPSEFFSVAEGGIEMFLLEALEKRPRDRSVFYSLEFVVFFFLIFEALCRTISFANRCPSSCFIHFFERCCS